MSRLSVSWAYTTVVVPSVLVNACGSDSERVDTRFYRNMDGRAQPKHGWNSKKDKRNK